MSLASYDATYLAGYFLSRGNIEDSAWASVPVAGYFSNFATPGDVVLRAETEDLILTARSAIGAVRFGTGANDTEKMTITSAGNVGIGTTAPQSLLAVNGKITAKEVVVTTQGFPDYVFNPDYRLTPLNQVAAYIKEHHHLPEIPSEAEVRETGVDLGDLQVKLLAKVEELTLHMIQADERNNRLEERNNRVEQQNRELRVRIDRLEASKGK